MEEMEEEEDAEDAEDASCRVQRVMHRMRIEWHLFTGSKSTRSNENIHFNCAVLSWWWKALSKWGEWKEASQ
jgi:hypothetical protein